MSVEDARKAARELSVGQLHDAMLEVNIPTLLVVLCHLTNDVSWIRAPFVPGRPRGMDDNDSGGLSEELQRSVRDAAVRAVIDWRNGKLPDPGVPSRDLLIEMMSASAGEPVGVEFVEMVLEELGLARRGRPVSGPSGTVPDDFDVLVIGAGLGGVCAGIKLGEAGISYRIVEKNAALGGSWYENIYPGSGVDTPSHLYSYSFEQSTGWSRYYAKQDEIQSYFADSACKYEVLERISFLTRATAAVFDESTGRWIVDLVHDDGSSETLTPRVVISAVGQLNVPKIPDFPGMRSFEGEIFHTARWPSDADLVGKKVAVVGTGASAMQIVPIVAEDVDELVIFQRSPQWAGPNPNYFRTITPAARVLFESVPMYMQWYRLRLFWMFNDKVHKSLQIDPEWVHQERSINSTNDKHRAFFTEHIRSELGGRQDLLSDVLPDYPPFGKRMLIDNGWFRTLTRPNVKLVKDGVSGFTSDAVVTSNGDEYAADVVVLSTGFEALRLLDSVDIRGRGQRSIREVWGDDNGFAYLGIAVPGFPNFFCVYGPNTNLGHGGSIILHAECQVRYIVDLLSQMVEREVDIVDCKPEVFQDYVDRVDEAHRSMIWSHQGFGSWYRNESGRVVTNSPWRLVDYWRMTERADLNDYTVESLVSAPN